MEQYYPFQLEPLDYRFNDLEPVLDLQTVLLHHFNHQQAYVDGLNAALEQWPLYQQWSLTQLLTGLHRLPLKLKTQVRHNAGGVYNHQFYFNSMASPDGQQPGPALEQALRRSFGSADAFRRIFQDEAGRMFGSGWVWLVADPRGRLRVISTQDQDTPITPGQGPAVQGQTPLLCCDLWEHAYYLQYKNRRSEYVDAWWGLVNWSRVEERLNARLLRQDA